METASAFLNFWKRYFAGMPEANQCVGGTCMCSRLAPVRLACVACVALARSMCCGRHIVRCGSKESIFHAGLHGRGLQDDGFRKLFRTPSPPHPLLKTNGSPSFAGDPLIFVALERNERTSRGSVGPRAAEVASETPLEPKMEV